MRYCKDCKHFNDDENRYGPRIRGEPLPEPFCMHPRSLEERHHEDLVWGKTTETHWSTCERMRTHKVGACGVHGDLWEARREEA